MRDGFDVLYREQYAAVARFVRRQVGESAAEDVVASTFELAYAKLRDDHPHPVGWLFQTARNLMKAELRRRERERRALRDASVLAVRDAGDHDIETVRALLEALPPRHREVLQLTYWDRLAASDVGVVLGCSEQAVWKRISRAKTALRSAWTSNGSTSWEETLTDA